MEKESGQDQDQTTFYVGEWLVDPATGRIRRQNEEVKLEPKVMEVLCYMAARPGMVITREHLESDVWTGTIVGYDALTATIIKLRKALQDDSKNPKYIETLPKKGYRLIADVRKVNDQNEIPAQDKSVTKSGSGFKQLLIPVVLVSILIVVWSTVSNEKDTSLTVLPNKPSIVVLPFSNLNKESGQNYFSNGITEDLTTE